MLVTKNNTVACTPFVVKADNRNGLALVTKKLEVIPLSVLYPTDPADSGIRVNVDDVVYVKAESIRSPWATDIYHLEGNTGQFILVPLSEIVFIDKAAKRLS